MLREEPVDIDGMKRTHREVLNTSAPVEIKDSFENTSGYVSEVRSPIAADFITQFADVCERGRMKSLLVPRSAMQTTLCLFMAQIPS